MERFKHMAGDRGYQTLINETLKSSVNQADMADTLRQMGLPRLEPFSAGANIPESIKSKETP